MDPERLTECENRRLLQWLERSGPDEWHAVAFGWNWDNGIGPLQWIVSQPRCDAATAQFVFWTACMGDGPELRQLAADIVQRWSAGQYRTVRFSVKGHIDPSAATAAVAVPQGLDVAVDGPDEPAVGENFNEGIPAEITFACFEELGQTPPAWLLRQLGMHDNGGKPAPKDRVESLGNRLMMNELSEQEIDRLLVDPAAFRDFKEYRMFVDSAKFKRLSDEKHSMAKAGGDTSELQRQQDEILRRMSRPFDPQLYPDLVGNSPPGPRTRPFGRMDPPRPFGRKNGG